LPCAQSPAGQPAGAASGDQHALGEKPLPDAHQEHLRKPLLAQLVLHYGARSDGGHVLRALGTHLAQGLLVFGEEPETGARQAPPDPDPPAGGRRVHGELVPLCAGEQEGAQENGPSAFALRHREDVGLTGGSACPTLMHIFLWDRRFRLSTDCFTTPYAHRPARYARHTSPLRRIRDFCRRTVAPPGGARPRGDRLLPKAVPAATLSRRAAAVSPHH